MATKSVPAQMPRAVSLVQASSSRIPPQAAEFAERFYLKLFSAVPAVRGLFHAAMRAHHADDGTLRASFAVVGKSLRETLEEFRAAVDRATKDIWVAAFWLAASVT